MNKIFNVVWSKTKNCWIVVSEFVATGGGKGKKVRRKKSGVVTASMAAMISASTGNYRGQGAIAFGAYHYVNRDVLLGAAMIFLLMSVRKLTE